MRWLIALAVALAVVIGVGAATADPTPTRVRSWPPAMSVVTDDHVRQHATMTEQMRAMAHTGHMVDPMWSDMWTPGHIQAEERYQADIDRMLAR
jgi:hypothetical protein